jgi:hypothetical protein
MLNISLVENEKTASTRPSCADQRSDYLSVLGAKKVLELCVGPSLRSLEMSYSRNNIAVIGNDIEKRWQTFYSKGKWVIGDALQVSYDGFDAVVFAPPLSRGCTGRREDSLSVSEVFPKYTSFLERLSEISIAVLVLPGRSFATRYDRAESYSLLSKINKTYDVVPLYDEKGKVVKYYDVYIK